MIQMKRTHLFAFLLLTSPLAFVSCDALLDVDSERVVLEDQYDMKASNDSLYAMFGLLNSLQELADSYVLLGELRADLMDVTEFSDPYLNEINTHNVSAENPYTDNLTAYYAIINNCNYIVHKVDTSIVKNTYKVNKRLMAAAKSIRAWVYMQLALNYGEAVYYDKPLLDMKEAEKDYPVYTLDELAPHLIADLLPFRDERRLELGSIYSYDLYYAQFSVDMVLGDLYLWTGDYLNAATAYQRMMDGNNCFLRSTFASSLEALNSAFTGRFTSTNWAEIFNPYGGEHITYIGASNEYKRVFKIDTLCYNYMVKCSDQAFNNWRNQHYFYSAVLDTMADLRMYGSVSDYAFGVSSLMDENSKHYVFKHIYMNSLDDSEVRMVGVYRLGLLYLRYAEAVNRLGKPNLAMAVLKYGLNNATLNNPTFVPASEVERPVPAYMDFSDPKFNANIGVRARACGNPRFDTIQCVIPTLPTLADSVQAVEDILINELALEMACEGNRFHDLMRFAIRRDDNHVLADRVAAKHPANKVAMQTKLMDRKNWYLTK